jgi:hydrogenase maturation protease
VLSARWLRPFLLGSSPHCALRLQPRTKASGATLNPVPRILIIAYGNPLRSDDGVALRAADALENKLPKAEVQILRLHQLGPELAETASWSEYLIFVDAASNPSSMPGEICVVEIHPEDGEDPSRFSHVLTPRHIVGLAVTLYDAKPKAILVTLTGASFDHGESLSPPVEAALPVLIDRIEGIVQSVLREQQKA